MDVWREQRIRCAGFLLMMWWVWAGCRPTGEVAEGARLRLTTDEPGPGTAYELVLDQPVVGFGEVGMTSAVSPLVVHPPLDGQFVWRSRRSGVFTPAALPRMGVAYEFTLRTGLTNGSGQPLPAQLRRRVVMPAPTIRADAASYWDPEAMPEIPTLVLGATTPMDAADLARHAHFTDGSRRVGVVLEVLKRKPGMAPQREPTWRERYDALRPGNGGDTWEEGALWEARPERPLVSTSRWKLVVGAGVRTADGGAVTTQAVETGLGISPPFELAEFRSRNLLSGGRQLVLRFNRPVAPETASNVTAWLRCRPSVEDFRVERSAGGRTLAVSGGFEIGREYEVTLGRELRAAEGPVLERGSTNRCVFEPIEPSVWMQAYDAVQPAWGARAFPLLAVNTPEVRVRVKAIDAVGLIPALKAYERYLRRDGFNPPDTVEGAALDYAAMAGRTVLDTNVMLGKVGVDEPQRIGLGWDGLVGKGKTGVYFVEADLHGVNRTNGAAGSTRVGPQSLVQLTDLGLVTKRGLHGTWVWVFSQKTSKPVEGAQVSLRTDEDEELAVGMTDAQGVVRLAAVTNAVWMVASHGTDRLAMRAELSTTSTWMFGLEGQALPDSGTRVLGFTDREAYQPGQTLHLKLLARQRRESGWTLPGTNGMGVEVTGPLGDRLLRTNLVMGATGSVGWEWRLPDGIRGNLTLKAQMGDASWQGGVEVREFQPPAFEVKVGHPDAVAAGQPVRFEVSGRYLHGQPLQRARVRWHVNATDEGFAPAGWSGFGFIHHPHRERWEEGPPRDAHASGDAVMQSGGPLSMTPELPFNPQVPGPQMLGLEVAVTDLNQQTERETSEWVRHASDYYLGFRWMGGEEALLEIGRPLRFQVVATGAAGEPWTNAVPVRARLRRVEWKSVAVQRAGHALGHERQRTLREIDSGSFVTQPVVRQGAAWVAMGDGLAMAGVKEPGEYVLDLESADAAGRRVETHVRFHVAGDAHLAWHWRNGARMELVPAHEDPSVDATRAGTFLVEAPFSGTALVTVEREDVQAVFVRELRGNAPRIEVPLDAAAVPNAFVGVLLVRGIEGNPHQHPMPEWRMGYRMVRRSSEADRLRVAVAVDSAVLQPRDTAAVQVTVTDVAGRTVSGAEVTLYAVDEGYLRMKSTAVPDPGAQLMEPLALRVESGVSIPLLLKEDPELRSFSNKGHVGGGGGRSLMVRKNFEPCPYWNAALMTGADGTVRVRFAVPDALTRYRVVAVATEGAARMGTGTTTVEVRKPLMIESALPRYAHVGDRLTARAIVTNPGTNALHARVTIRPGRAAVLTSGTVPSREVDVPAGGTVPVDFDVEMVSAGEDPWLWQVESGTLTDAVSVPLPVRFPLPGVRDAQFVRASGPSTVLVAGMDPVVLENPEELVVRVASGPLALVGEGVEQLLRYPYGCAEQTGSSLVPWLALRDWPELMPSDAGESDRAIREGVRRFWTMQTASGGLAYWPGGVEPQRWASAYGAWILGLARKTGAEVDARRMERLLKWLGEQWRSNAATGPGDLHERCLTALALATCGVPETALNQALLQEAERLGMEDRSLLALALAEAGSAKEGAGLLALPPRADSRHGRFGDAARETALRLLAGARCGLPAAVLDAEIGRILGLRQRGHWTTTQGNAWVVWALSEHAKVADGRAAVVGRLRVGDRTLPLPTGRTLVRVSTPLTAKDVAAGVTLEREGAGPLWVEATVSGRRRVDAATVAAEDRGFSVRRVYERLDENDQRSPADRLMVGDRVLVTLELDIPEAAEWVAVDDPVPSILEAAVERFVSPIGTDDPTEGWRSDHVEVRGDRRRVFLDSLGEGRHRIRYLARVRAAGVAVAGPVTVEAMYQPERRGHSAGVRLGAGMDVGR